MKTKNKKKSNCEDTVIVDNQVPNEAQDYITKLNDGTIKKADLMCCEEIFKRLTYFDPKGLSELHGNMTITAMTGAGKTVLIKDLLKHNEKHYKEVHLISGTAKMQPVYNFIPRENIKEEWDEEFLKHLLSSRKAIKERDNKVELDPILIIFDDMINDRGYKKSLAIDDLFIKGRHYGISMWFLTQNFTSLKVLQRGQVRWAVSFCHDTSAERRKFSDSYLSAQNEIVARLLFNKITKEKAYQCVIVEVHKVGVEPHEKIKKYIADGNIKDPKIKPVIPMSSPDEFPTVKTSRKQDNHNEYI